MKVRVGRPEDLPELERLRLAMPYPGSLFWEEESYYEQALLRLRDCLPRLEELADWQIPVLLEEGKPTGYLQYVVDEEHGVTHQLQALLTDVAVFSFEGLAALVKRARKVVAAFENEYLVVDLPPADKRLQLWFYRCGFRAEQQRVVRRFARGHQGASSPLYRLRKAEPDDLPFILEVHSAHPIAYLPGGRDVDLATLELRYQLHYMALDLTSPSCRHYCVLQEVSSGRCVGYIFVQEGPLFRGDKSFYVYDVGIHPDFSGRGLSHYMRGAAESLAGQDGGLVYGDGSLGAPSIASWHEQMGYGVDSLRYALDCRDPC